MAAARLPLGPRRAGTSGRAASRCGWGFNSRAAGNLELGRWRPPAPHCHHPTSTAASERHLGIEWRPSGRLRSSGPSFKVQPAQPDSLCLQGLDQMSKKRAAFEDITNATACGVSLGGGAISRPLSPGLRLRGAGPRLHVACLAFAHKSAPMGWEPAGAHSVPPRAKELRSLSRPELPLACRFPSARRRPTMPPSRAPLAPAPAAVTCSRCASSYPSLDRCVCCRAVLVFAAGAARQHARSRHACAAAGQGQAPARLIRPPAHFVCAHMPAVLPSMYCPAAGMRPALLPCCCCLSGPPRNLPPRPR